MADITKLFAPPIKGRFRLTPSGCMVWTGYIHQTGYGRVGNGYAHRVAYEQVIGPIPAGKQIDHLCRNRPCINPFHMEAVTSRENTARGTNQVARYMHATHCKHGHEFDEKNTYRFPLENGRMGRACRICMNAKSRRRKARRAQERQVA